MKKCLVWIGLLLLFLLIDPAPVSAHSYSIAYTKVDVTSSHIVVQYAIDSITLMECLPEIDDNNDYNVTLQEVDQDKSKLLKWIKSNLIIKVNGNKENWQSVNYSLNPDPAFKNQFKYKKGFDYNQYKIKGDDYLTLTMNYSPASSGSSVQVEDHIHTFVKSLYGNFLNVTNNGKTIQTVLFSDAWSYHFAAGPYPKNTPIPPSSSDHPSVQPNQHPETPSQQPTPTPPPKPNSAVPSPSSVNSVDWLRFLELGSNHILSGRDHLLFLFTLILLKMRWKDYAKIITSFSIAHSLTLALSVLGIISLPTRLIESAIAVSILYVAIENLFFRNAAKHRWWLTFVFGLIHGLGFSELLVKMHLPRSQVVQALFSFNVGIEITQLSLVALIFPVLWYWHRSKWYWSSFRVFNAAAACVAVFWIVQRVFF